MVGRFQDEGMRRLLHAGLVPIVHDRFQKAGDRKVACVLCGMGGYGDLDPMREGGAPSPWQLEHLLPHPFACSCGMAFTSAARWAAHMSKERHLPHDDSLRG